MTLEAPAETSPQAPHRFSGADVCSILHERGWLEGGLETGGDRDLQTWAVRAAELLGSHATDRASLSEMLALIFHYDAAALLQDAGSQSLMARPGAREVIRELGNCLLDGGDVDSDRFKLIVDRMKAKLTYRGPALFHPIRLALAGREGAGSLDRVILLLDAAARIDFVYPVKNTRQRMLEFCAALD